jgi:uncharacterized MAPEG superfamily protein
MGASEAAKVLFGCLFAYVLNIVGNLWLRKTGVLDRLWPTLVHLLGADNLISCQPQAFAVGTLIYWILLWTFSHLLSIVIGGWVTDPKSHWSNKEPRKNSQLHVPGSVQSRLYSAHLNAGEQFIFAAVAVVLCIQMNVDFEVINRYCMGLVLFRSLFHVFYVLDLDVLRSLSFEMAFGNMLLLFLNAGLGPHFENFLSSLY